MAPRDEADICPSSASWPSGRPAATLVIVSKPSPETIAIIAVGATLLIAVCSVGIGWECSGRTGKPGRTG